jgi:hypothetical protein
MERITSDEFNSLPPASSGNVSGRHKGPLRLAIEVMDIDTGIKMACTYRHITPPPGRPQTACKGRVAANVCAKKLGLRVTSRCIEGMLYVLRIW